MKLIHDRDIYQILKDTENKKVIVYGAGVFAGETIKMLECLDIHVDYCIDTETDGTTCVCVDKLVKDPSYILHEKNRCFVLIAKEDIKACMDTLDSMGLVYLKDYNTVFHACARLNWRMPCPLDASMGYSMPSENLADVRVFGNLDTAENRIAILGDSASDPNSYTWKSWGEMFYELCTRQGQSVAVILGAVAGYSSSQVLMKLIRDILPYRPNIVVNYSGVSDRSSQTPYATTYQMRLFRRIAAMGWEDPYGRKLPNGFCCGKRKTAVRPADHWLHNQRIMHGICKEFSMRYIAFLQPNLICKQRGRRDEEVFFYVPDREIRDKLEFRESIRSKMHEMRYLVDATTWMDDYDGLFYDYAHVTEDGNRIVAEHVYQYLFEEGE